MMLEEKKVKALMITIYRMFARLQQTGVEDEELFKLFEIAKSFKFAEDEKEFQLALNRLSPPIYPLD